MCTEILQKILDSLQSIQNDKTAMIISIISLVVAILTLIATFYVPVRIMQAQTYSGLVAEYRSYDFAVAIQGIIEFFTVECASDIDNVPFKYKERFFRDMYSAPYSKYIELKDVQNWYKSGYKNSITQKEPALCLHYQRRLLGQFFYQLDLCTRYSRRYKKQIQQDFTKNEAKIIRILLAINEALESDPILFKDLDCDYRVRPDKYVKGQNHWLSHLFHILDKSKPRMQYSQKK